jgi:hypothetical protein
MRSPTIFLAMVALLAVTAEPTTARADDSSSDSTVAGERRGPVEGRGALRVTGSAMLLAGGLAFLPAAWTAGTVAVGALEPGGAERASKDFQEPLVFVPLAAGFVAVMVGAALLVIVDPPTDSPSRASKRSASTSPFVITF